ncbi:hypothetical protein PVOR_21624 [Paenibacillus vortex V453]|jgi:hypothetical protein|uniref:Uncharacterized protein n=1 Tax=Paenibacillus vortex V453 TaxID=715225 RepID=A0A2R9SRG9_9BACL|nr:hypothetical protein [Paenibacillus vortex]EFU39922.1 hypothetical protein PVOR_21624 [Paenibacillus vortex V453]
MTKLASSILEMIRMMIMMMIAAPILGSIEQSILTSWIPWKESYFLFLFSGNILWFLVLYRNRLQFSGWYRSSETQRKLSRNTTRIVMTLGSLLILTPVLITWLSA